ncbi:MAG: hypothetical protein WD669_06410 [Pirellulales bacterium]
MLSFLATFALALSFSAAAPEPLQWEASYGKALEATRAVEHPLLVVIDNPTAAEARLAPELLNPAGTSGKEVEMLRPYQLCHVDITTEYGQKVAEAFKAKAFPYVAVIDKTGSVIIFSKAGKISTEEWGNILTTYKTGDRSMAVSRVSYKIVNPSGGTIMNGSCPNCQQRSF